MIEVKSIEELNINDSVLIKTEVRNDLVEMLLDYVEDYEKQTSSIRNLVFEQCRRVSFRINPGFDSPNSLLNAEETAKESIRCIRIEMNTTAGVIEIECANVFLSEAQSQ